MRPWGRRPLTIPPNSTNAWIQLAVWELWMGMLICIVAGLGIDGELDGAAGALEGFFQVDIFDDHGGQNQERDFRPQHFEQASCTADHRGSYSANAASSRFWER